MRKKMFPTQRSHSWLIKVDVDFDDDNKIDVDVEGNDFFACWLPAGEWLPTGVPWSGAAGVHDLQPWEVREHEIIRLFTRRLKAEFPV